MRRAGVAAAVLLAACDGTEGTITVELATAPDSTILDGALALRVTLTNPTTTTTIQRANGGFALDVELPAEGPPRALVIEGLDAGGATLAVGQSPVFPITAINARVVVYMAPPLSLARSPLSLVTPRTDVGITELSYGAAIVGGLAGGALSTDLAVYNAYDHTILAGLALPAARRAPCVASTASNDLYIFGGEGATGPTGTLWTFATATPPNGAYQQAAEQPALARTCASTQPVETAEDQFVIAGTPVVAIAGSVAAARTDLATLPPHGASIVASDGTFVALFTDGTTLTRIRNNAIETRALATPFTPLGAVANPADRSILFVATEGFVRVDPITLAAATPIPTRITREAFAIAATERHVLVHGGTVGGVADPTADAYAADTLLHLATIPITVSQVVGARAIGLPNQQILVVGGEIELFTPPAP